MSSMDSTHLNLSPSSYLEKLIHRLNQKTKTYNQISFDTEFSNTKNLTIVKMMEGLVAMLGQWSDITMR
jgi:hypothetical protein